MSVKIRLARYGAKKKPFYHVVAAPANAPRDGKFLEKLGTYNPLLAKDNELRITLKNDRVLYWLSVGAQPTETVKRIIAKAGLTKPASSN